jgi:hypothetical protein
MITGPSHAAIAALERNKSGRVARVVIERSLEQGTVETREN